LRELLRDLNRMYAARPALHVCDDDWAGFSWLECDDRERAVTAFVRRDPAGDAFVVAVLNLSGVGFERYRLGVPAAGTYREVLNTDAGHYAGRNRGNFGSVASEDVPMHGQAASLELYLPPQTLLLLAPDPAPATSAKAAQAP